MHAEGELPEKFKIWLTIFFTYIKTKASIIMFKLNLYFFGSMSLVILAYYIRT